MGCELEGAFGHLAAQLPEYADEIEPFVLDETTLPVPPKEMSTDRIFITKNYIQRLPGCRGDQVNLIAPKSTFRQLGLLALAILFHDEPERVAVQINNAASPVQHLVLEYKHIPKSQGSGFRTRPLVFRYLPDHDVPHSFSTCLKGFAAPLLRLTNFSDCQNSELDWQKRDTLSGIGGTFATAEIAEFLLNAGQKSSKWEHFTIPPNHTFFSAEVSLWTPESWNNLQSKLRDFNQQSRR